MLAVLMKFYPWDNASNVNYEKAIDEAQRSQKEKYFFMISY